MSNTIIHPTAIIHEGAVIGNGVAVGPYCVVGAKVTLADNVKLHSHVVVEGNTTIGEGTEVFPFASLGHIPQDLKFGGEDSRLVIGKNNKIREHTTMNPGTAGDKMETVVGDNCLFMMSTHVAHDCIVGNNVILANNATLAGHVSVGNNAIIGGLSAVRQFIRIGEHAMIGGMSGVENDVIPYGLVMGERATLAGLNLVGLERRGFEKTEITALRQAYKELFMGEGTLSERVEKLGLDYPQSKLVTDVLEFINTRTNNALCQPRKG